MWTIRYLTAYRNTPGHTGLIEGDVTVLANSGEEKLDVDIRFDGSLVCVAFHDKVRNVAIENMHLRRGYINSGIT